MITKLAVIGAGLCCSITATLAASPMITVSSPAETTGIFYQTMSVPIDLATLPNPPARLPAFWLSEQRNGKITLATPGPAQFEPDSPGSRHGKLWWLMPPGERGERQFAVNLQETPSDFTLLAKPDPVTGRWDILERGKPVLSYNYQTNAPGVWFEKVHPDNRKYARARSDYIHPLYGLNGEELTKDWSLDHPHHRGIYWAWPEVDYRQERGDLHALQRVFARPTGRCAGENGPLFAQIDAENLWLWEDRDPIVRERALIRAWRAGENGRWIDLEFQFTALTDGVSIARRETRLYGGLNIRLAPVKDQQILVHTDPDGTNPRQAWSELNGYFANSKETTGLAVLQSPSNPDFPGDWVQYPELNWCQPTFPAAGTRFALAKDKTATLRYRLWIHAGKADAARLAAAWNAYAMPSKATFKPQ